MKFVLNILMTRDAISRFLDDENFAKKMSIQYLFLVLLSTKSLVCPIKDQTPTGKADKYKLQENIHNLHTNFYIKKYIVNHKVF